MSYYEEDPDDDIFTCFTVFMLYFWVFYLITRSGTV